MLTVEVNFLISEIEQKIKEAKELVRFNSTELELKY